MRQITVGNDPYWDRPHLLTLPYGLGLCPTV
jgi:hypothetical protein